MLYQGLVIDKTYQVCNEIGSGGMGVIYLAVHLRLNKYVVLKRLKNTEADISSLRNEVDVLKSLRHSFLPQVYDFVEFDGDVFAVIDYIEGYDLKYYIENQIEVTESQLIKWLSQLCQVLEYMHGHQPRVLHMDIKPANIIIQPNGDVCLIDFGISMLGNGRLRGISYEYSSPEQYYNASLLEQGYHDGLYELDDRTDIYSLGATFYELITGLKPSCTAPLGRIEQSARIPISEPLAKIIDRSIAYQREDRYSDSSQMLRAVNNMFKLSDKYKLYVFAQAATSLLACLLIVLGTILIYNGVVEKDKSSFEQDYNAYIAALQSNDTESAIMQAKQLMNNSRYQSMMDSDMTAEIYHSMGDCYFDKEDFLNASVCYEKAVSSLQAEEKADIYYRDYALSLLEQQRVSDARDVLSKMTSMNSDSPSCMLVSAQLSYQEMDYETAQTLLKRVLAVSEGKDSRYSAYMLLGDIANEKGEKENAIGFYSSAVNEKQTARILRKLGITQLELGTIEKSSKRYQDALTSFKTLCEHFSATEDDMFNYAQCYLLADVSSGANKAIEVLEDYIADHPDNCSSYILLAIAADSADDRRTAEYCRKAHNLYLSMSDAEQERLDSESLKRVKALYKKYVGEEW